MITYEKTYPKTLLKWSRTELTDNLDEQIDRIKRKRPSVIIIDGQHGAGKTTLAAHIGQYVEDQFGSSFDYEEQVGKGMERFLPSLERCMKNKKRVCIYDEAEDFDRKGAITRFNRMLNRIFSVYRATGILIIIVIGMVKHLDKTPLEKGLIRFCINIFDQRKGSASFRVYDAVTMFYMIDSMRDPRNKITLQVYNRFSPCVIGKVKPADPKTQKLWDTYDVKGKRLIIKTASMDAQGLVDIEAIRHASGYSINTVRSKILKLNIKEAVKVGTKKYYSKEVIEIIKSSRKIKEK